MNFINRISMEPKPASTDQVFPALCTLIISSSSLATRKDASTLLECLEKYCHWSGQKLNNSKPRISLQIYSKANSKSHKTHFLNEEYQERCSLSWGAHVSSPLPSTSVFTNQAWKRLSGWRSKTLSWAGDALSSTLLLIPFLTIPCPHSKSLFLSVTAWCAHTKNSGGSLRRRMESF